MLNALYGDPTRPLPLLASVSKAQSHFKAMPELLKESDFAMQQKRKNAVIDVLRSICQQEYPVSVSAMPLSEQQACETALALLRVGDLKQAIQVLNRNRLTKLSLLVSQAASNRHAMIFCEKVRPASIH